VTVPSVGRIVHYAGEGGDCHAAIITGVGPHPDADGTVHLTVFYEVGTMIAIDVEHAEDKAAGAERHPASTWHWPERIGGRP
jgi:hypothetical protein